MRKNLIAAAGEDRHVTAAVVIEIFDARRSPVWFRSSKTEGRYTLDNASRRCATAHSPRRASSFRSSGGISSARRRTNSCRSMPSEEVRMFENRRAADRVGGKNLDILAQRALIAFFCSGYDFSESAPSTRLANCS
jgi:hypothetical protein